MSRITSGGEMKHIHDHDHAHHEMPTKRALNPTGHSLRDYVPLIVVFAFVGLSSALHVVALGNTFDHWMAAVMGYFFMYFALFKLVDLPGFAEGFHHYDLIAQRSKMWAWLYPFVELGLGVLYLLNIDASALHMATLVVTLLNVVSVAIKLAKREVFMCACLGTILKVPLTTVTLIEYGLMGVMALVMLIG